MESPIQKQPSFTDLARRLVQYLYENSRWQFHPSLYIQLYSVAYVGTMAVGLWTISLIPGFSYSLNYDLVGLFIGCISIGELVRGHVKYWFGGKPEDWHYPAMVVGGMAVTLTFWIVVALMWGMNQWYEPIVYVAAGAVLNPLLGWLMCLAEKERIKKNPPNNI